MNPLLHYFLYALAFLGSVLACAIIVFVIEGVVDLVRRTFSKKAIPVLESEQRSSGCFCPVCSSDVEADILKSYREFQGITNTRCGQCQTLQNWNTLGFPFVLEDYVQEHAPKYIERNAGKLEEFEIQKELKTSALLIQVGKMSKPSGK